LSSTGVTRLPHLTHALTCTVTVFCITTHLGMVVESESPVNVQVRDTRIQHLFVRQLHHEGVQVWHALSRDHRLPATHAFIHEWQAFSSAMPKSEKKSFICYSTYRIISETILSRLSVLTTRIEYTQTRSAQTQKLCVHMPQMKKKRHQYQAAVSIVYSQLIPKPTCPQGLPNPGPNPNPEH